MHKKQKSQKLKNTFKYNIQIHCKHIQTKNLFIAKSPTLHKTLTPKHNIFPYQNYLLNRLNHIARYKSDNFLLNRIFNNILVTQFQLTPHYYQ